MSHISPHIPASTNASEKADASADPQLSAQHEAQRWVTNNIPLQLNGWIHHTQQRERAAEREPGCQDSPLYKAAARARVALGIASTEHTALVDALTGAEREEFLIAGLRSMIEAVFQRAKESGTAKKYPPASKFHTDEISCWCLYDYPRPGANPVTEIPTQENVKDWMRRTVPQNPTGWLAQVIGWDLVNKVHPGRMNGFLEQATRHVSMIKPSAMVFLRQGITRKKTDCARLEQFIREFHEKSARVLEAEESVSEV